jgi:hypothetical protein
MYSFHLTRCLINGVEDPRLAFARVHRSHAANTRVDSKAYELQRDERLSTWRGGSAGGSSPSAVPVTSCGGDGAACSLQMHAVL